MKTQQKKKLAKLYPLLKVLRKLNAEDRIEVLKHLNDDSCSGLRECAVNAFCNGCIGKKAKEILKSKIVDEKTRSDLRSLVNNSRLSPAKRRGKLVQVGGSFGLIISSILPLLGQLLFPPKQ